MNKFIRTKYRILEVTKDAKGRDFIVFGKALLDYETFIKSDDDIIKEADTIEELFMPNDLLVVGDDKNQMPIFIESLEYLNAWLYCHDIYHIKEIYIKNGNDFICIAKATGKKHKLILI